MSGTALFGACHHAAKMDGVQQVKEMPGQREVPAADVLISAVHRLSRRSDPALALIDFMDEALAVLHADDHVVPEGQQRGLESGGMQRGAQTYQSAWISLNHPRQRRK